MQAMRYTGVAIVGGGLAGSTAAAMLGRAGISAVLIDPHVSYPPELRCESVGSKPPVISHGPSVTLAFDVEPVGRPPFEFPALTYWPGRAAAKMAYLSIFPIGNKMRGNLMVYRDMDDPWLSAFKAAPEQTMCE